MHEDLNLSEKPIIIHGPRWCRRKLKIIQTKQFRIFLKSHLASVFSDTYDEKHTLQFVIDNTFARYLTLFIANGFKKKYNIRQIPMSIMDDIVDYVRHLVADAEDQELTVAKKFIFADPELVKNVLVPIRGNIYVAGIISQPLSEDEFVDNNYTPEEGFVESIGSDLQAARSM